MELKLNYDIDDIQIEKTKCFNKLLELARELSKDIPFLEQISKLLMIMFI